MAPDASSSMSGSVTRCAVGIHIVGEAAGPGPTSRLHLCLNLLDTAEPQAVG